MSTIAIDNQRSRTVAFTTASGAALLSTCLLLLESGLYHLATADASDVINLLLFGASLANVLVPLLIYVIADVVATAASMARNDIALLRMLGAQKTTIRHRWARHITYQSLVPVALGAATGYPLALLSVHFLTRVDLVPPTFQLLATPLAGAATIGLMAGIAYVAGYLAVLKITGLPPVMALADSQARLGPPSEARRNTGYVLLAIGGTTAFAPLFGGLEVGAGGAGSSALTCVIALALLGPGLVRSTGQYLRQKLPPRIPYALRLAIYNYDGYAYRLAAGITVLAMALAIVVTYGLANTTIAEAIRLRPELVDGSAEAAAEATVSAHVNLVVLLAVFGFLLVGAFSRLSAVAASRRAELRRLWQLGATRGQLRSMVAAESLVAWVLSTLAGVVVAGPILFLLSVGLLERPWPSGPVWIPVLAVGAMGVVIFATAPIATAGVGRRPRDGRLNSTWSTAA